MHQCLRKNRAELSDGCRREQLILEQAEAENVELRPSLLHSCASERTMFCKEVQPGNGRVFRRAGGWPGRPRKQGCWQRVAGPGLGAWVEKGEGALSGCQLARAPSGAPLVARPRPPRPRLVHGTCPTPARLTPCT